MNSPEGKEPNKERPILKEELNFDMLEEIEGELAQKEKELPKDYLLRLKSFAERLGMKKLNTYSKGKKLARSIQQTIDYRRSEPVGKGKTFDSEIMGALQELRAEKVQGTALRTGGTIEEPLYSKPKILRVKNIPEPVPDDVSKPEVKKQPEQQESTIVPQGNNIGRLWNTIAITSRATPEQKIEAVDQLQLHYRGKLAEHSEVRLQRDTRDTLVELAEKKAAWEREILSRGSAEEIKPEPIPEKLEISEKKLKLAGIKFGLTKENLQEKTITELQEMVVPVVAEKMRITPEQALEFISDPRKFVGGKESDNEIFEPEPELVTGEIKTESPIVDAEAPISETDRIFNEQSRKLEEIYKRFKPQARELDGLLDSEQPNLVVIKNKFDELSKIVGEVDDLSKEGLPADLDKDRGYFFDNAIWQIHGVYNNLKDKMEAKLATTSNTLVVEAPNTEEDLITDQEKKMDTILHQVRDRVSQAFRNDLINNGHYTPEEADEYLKTKVSRDDVYRKAQIHFDNIAAKLKKKQ